MGVRSVALVSVRRNGERIDRAGQGPTVLSNCSLFSLTSVWLRSQIHHMLLNKGKIQPEEQIPRSLRESPGYSDSKHLHFSLGCLSMKICMCPNFLSVNVIKHTTQSILKVKGAYLADNSSLQSTPGGKSRQWELTLAPPTVKGRRKTDAYMLTTPLTLSTLS